MTTTASLDIPLGPPDADQHASDEDVPEFDEKWLEHFYKECGRELTLSRTTLNQLTNWAAAVVAASLSGILALSKREVVLKPSYSPEFLIYVGALVVYLFTLRFFIRAIIAYVNGLRWNNLQAAIVRLKVLAVPVKSGGPLPDAAYLRRDLRDKIRDLYFGWHAPAGLSRGAQLTSTLILGFGLLLALPLFLVAMTASRFVLTSPIGRGITVFALGCTAVEFYDFSRSSWFDTAKAAAARRTPRAPQFPTPRPRDLYFTLWVASLLVSIAVAVIPTWF